MATTKDFEKLDIRVGKVIGVEDFPEARKPSYKLKIDFGEGIGIKSSSAQLVDLYKKEELKGKLVLGVELFNKLRTDNQLRNGIKRNSKNLKEQGQKER